MKLSKIQVRVLAFINLYEKLYLGQLSRGRHRYYFAQVGMRGIDHRTVRKLESLGLIKRQPISITEPSYYTLTPAGRAALEEEVEE